MSPIGTLDMKMERRVWVKDVELEGRGTRGYERRRESTKTNVA